MVRGGATPWVVNGRPAVMQSPHFTPPGAGPPGGFFVTPGGLIDPYHFQTFVLCPLFATVFTPAYAGP
jgi:hypothetical protein